MKEYLYRATTQKKLKLTVQSCGNGKFRLGINTKDSSEIFKRRCREVGLNISENNKINTKTTCGPPNDKENLEGKKYKKGYDLYQMQIDKWIKSKHFHCFEKGKPTKLEFLILESNCTIILKFTGITKNRDCKCHN